jgi:hypothetical protein
MEITGFLKGGQDFFTEYDVNIKGNLLTPVEDIVDQLNEHMEEDY